MELFLTKKRSHEVTDVSKVGSRKSHFPVKSRLVLVMGYRASPMNPVAGPMRRGKESNLPSGLVTIRHNHG
jgi:hypothetical protein